MKKRIRKAIKNLKFAKREFIIFLIFFMFFLIIISKVFSYTVFNYDYYKDLADKQQI
jgi:cell division protein FtsI/penicillin-binding protein 2